MKVLTVLLAGGKGSRMQAGVNKVLLPLCGKSIIRRSAEAFFGCADKMVIVCSPSDEERVRQEIALSDPPFPCIFVPGGNTRQLSALNGLLALSCAPEDIVLIHDAARCLVSRDVITRVIQSVTEYGSGIPAVPAVSTYKICNPDGFVVQTPERSSLYEIQTPQGFTAETILPVSLRAANENREVTDDAGLMEAYGFPVRIVPGSRGNIKITTQEDMITGAELLTGGQRSMRIGMGYDVHQLTEGRKLILCGVEIPWSVGLLGHSDADVALHALMDALLGACALGDIGRHFPDTDGQYSNISSLLLLKKTRELILQSGFRPANTDVTIVAQKPKLAPFIPRMVTNIAQTLELPETAVNVKATTTEKLGFEGRQEGISAYAVCTVLPV